MNKAKFIIGMLLVFLGFNFTSCEDEPIDPVLLIQVPPANLCAAPSSLSVSNFVGNSVSVTWTATQGAAWEVQYGLDGFAPGSGTTVAATANNATISGLTTTNNYDFYVRTSCSGGLFSNWIGPVGVGSSVVLCSSPTNLIALRSASNATQVNVTWNANGDENTWEVQYGATGFTIGSGTVVPATTNNKAITGLLANTGYDFYVRSKCDGSDSNWVGPAHVNPQAVVVDTTPALMTANIGGTQYNSLKPYMYSLTNVDVIVTGATGDPVRYLKIQGTDNNTSINLNNSRQIDLHIPMDKWAAGSYVLNNDSVNGTNECWASLLLFTNPDTDAIVGNGTLTVTEFNLGTKRIKGTFSFPYQIVDAAGNPAGNAQVLNGTFTYGLDDPYFD